MTDFSWKFTFVIPMSTLAKTIFVRGQRPNFYKQVDLKLHEKITAHIQIHRSALQMLTNQMWIQLQVTALISARLFRIAINTRGTTYSIYCVYFRDFALDRRVVCSLSRHNINWPVYRWAQGSYKQVPTFNITTLH